MGSSPHSEHFATVRKALAWDVRHDDRRVWDDAEAALRNLEEQYKHLENELDDMTGQFCNEAIHLTRAEDRVRELEEQLEKLEAENLRLAGEMPVLPQPIYDPSERERAERLQEQLEAAVPQWLYDSKVDELRSVEEQYEDMRCQWEIQAQAATGYFDELAGLKEQFEILQSAAQEVETLAFRQYLDWMHFHEVAMAKPFEAETEAQDFARRVSSLLTIALGPDSTIEVVDSNPARVSERDTGSRAEEPGEPPHPDSADASRSETPASSPAEEALGV